MKVLKEYIIHIVAVIAGLFLFAVWFTMRAKVDWIFMGWMLAVALGGIAGSYFAERLTMREHGFKHSMFACLGWSMFACVCFMNGIMYHDTLDNMSYDTLEKRFKMCEEQKTLLIVTAHRQAGINFAESHCSDINTLEGRDHENRND